VKYTYKQARYIVFSGTLNPTHFTPTGKIWPILC